MNKKIVILLAIVSAVLLLVTYSLLNSNLTSHPVNNSWRPDERGLVKFYEKVVEHEIDQDYESLYELELDQFKEYVSLQQYLNEMSKLSKPAEEVTFKYEILNKRVDGNIGIITRKKIVCITSVCTGEDRLEQVLDKIYIYSGDRWNLTSLYLKDDEYFLPTKYPIFCSRKSPYEVSSEFNRIIDLIVDKLSAPNGIGLTQDLIYTKELSNGISRIRNCLSIKYDDGEVATNATTEGVFYAKPETDKYNIYVSSKYRSMDDLAKALLLVHELTHVVQYVNNYPVNCFEKEGEAFGNEIALFRSLNQEEKNSLVSRASNSTLVKNELDYIEFILDESIRTGKYINDTATDIVKDNPAYIKQCAQ